jgi:proline racemase
MIVPKVTGSAYLTALNGHIIEKNDKIGRGFTV